MSSYSAQFVLSTRCPAPAEEGDPSHRAVPTPEPHLAACAADQTAGPRVLSEEICITSQRWYGRKVTVKVPETALARRHFLIWCRQLIPPAGGYNRRVRRPDNSVPEESSSPQAAEQPALLRAAYVSGRPLPRTLWPELVVQPVIILWKCPRGWRTMPPSSLQTTCCLFQGDSRAAGSAEAFHACCSEAPVSISGTAMRQS